jgi:glutathione peroxidase-family protein
MTTKNLLRISLLLFLVIGFTACKNGKSHFTVKGKIEGAADSTLYLYKRGITGADLVDSAKIGKDATFEIKTESPQYPDLYVLALGKQMINLAVDSLETIEISGKYKTFATEYQVKGSVQSDFIRKLYLKQLEVSKMLKQLKSQLDKKEIADSTYQSRARQSTFAYRDLAKDIILNNLRDLSAYYALFQQIDGYVVFDPLVKEDSRYYAAVATAWDTYHPKSSRTEHLKNYTLNTLAKRRALEGKAPSIMDKATTVDASEFYNISLPGIDERNIELKSFRGKTVLLDFTVYQDENAPAHNVALNKAYQKFKNSGFVIYQVSFNTPIHLWRTSASNLPWVCVREDNANSDLTSRFNIQALPTMFLVNKEGEIVKRIENKDNISEEVAKVL